MREALGRLRGCIRAINRVMRYRILGKDYETDYSRRNVTAFSIGVKTKFHLLYHFEKLLGVHRNVILFTR